MADLRPGLVGTRPESLRARLDVINLYSDTQTRPCAAMRQAIAAAAVGDEQSFADPTTLELEARVAALLDHEAAVFLPSGTMCNEIAIRVHVRAGGDEVYLHRSSHPVNAEAGGPAALSGAVLHTFDGADGRFTGEQLRDALRADGNRYQPRSRLVCIEQTANLPGGRVWSLEQMDDVLDVARDRGLRTHLDGARLLNAVVAGGVAAGEYAGRFDSAWIDFSKGLGAPVGAVLAGTRAFIDEAWRYKQMWGGAMRQSGMMAAGALYALEHNVDRLAEDHANARRLAAGLSGIPGVTVDVDAVETNMVFFATEDPRALVQRLAERGVLMGAMGPRVRAVTHLDVSAEQIDTAIDHVAAALREEEEGR